MELRILCKHLVADELNGKFTVGEDFADVVRINLPRFYDRHDLSQFSFRIAAAGKSKNAAVQILEMDSFDEQSIHLLWNVTSDFTAIPEKFTLVLTGVNSDNSVTIKFKSCPILVNSDETWEFLPSPELSEQLLNQTQSEVQKAIEAANRAETASQTPAPAEIYPATTTKLGGVKVDGKTITVKEDGTISAADSETLKNEISNVKSSQKFISSLAVQIAHPNNYLIYDDMGKPSVMVAIHKFYLDEVIDGASHTVHPAFIINGVEHDVIYISKYQNIVENNRAYSLPMRLPKSGITLDQACEYCNNKGAGWHMITNAEWSAIALWSKKNGTQPKGNNCYGRDVTESALPKQAKTANTQNQCLSGSGRESWYHDWTYAGIADLNGNFREWVTGLRLVNGEIQIIENNNAADWNNSISSDSALWKAILPNGTLVAPGTAGTLKFDYMSDDVTGITNQFQLNTVIEHNLSSNISGGKTFKSLTCKSGINVPNILKALTLFHDGSSSYKNDTFYFKHSNEALAYCGGGFSDEGTAGVFSKSLLPARSYSSSYVGFRCAFYGDI